MSAFKNIDISSTVIKQNVVSYTHNFTTSSAGIQSINIISGSVSSSYWNSLNVLFYSSGSPQYPKEHKFHKRALDRLKTRYFLTEKEISKRLKYKTKADNVTKKNYGSTK